MPDPRYTHGHHESVLRSHRWRTAENSAAYLLPHLAPGTTILDVGCGPGTITADLARRVAPALVVGIDASADIVEQAEAAHDEPNLRFEVGDVYDLGGRSFDVVHAHQVLQHLADPVAAMASMGKAATRLVAARDADYQAMAWHPADQALDDWLALYRGLARRNDGEPDAGRRLHAWARQAGFAPADITTTASVWCFTSDEDRAWWGGMWADRITTSAIARQAVDAGLATTSDLEAVAAAFRRWAADPDGWFAVLHGEVLCRVAAG